MRTIAVLFAFMLAAAPSVALAEPSAVAAPNSELCRSQLELLASREKLTAEEQLLFEAQCDCLLRQEQNADANAEGACAQER